MLTEHYKDPILTKNFAPPRKLNKKQVKNAVFCTFWKISIKKYRFFGARSATIEGYYILAPKEPVEKNYGWWA